MTDRVIGAGGDQLVVLLDGDGAAAVSAEVHSRPDGKQKAGDGSGSTQPKGPKTNWPEREVKPVQRDARGREEGQWLP